MPAHLVVVAGMKGGVGKTTVTTNLLVAARLQGIDAAGVDMDSQASLRTWADDRARAGHQPAITVRPGRLAGWRDAVAGTPARLVVLDLAPGLEGRREASALQELVAAARLVVLPTLAEGPTVRKLAEVGATLKRTGADVVFVLNKVIAGRSITQDARAYLGAAGELAPVEIPMRDAIHRATDAGLGVVEDPGYGGHDEFVRLWRFVGERVGLLEREAV
jgi:chromosome partitioning protein